MLPMSYSDRPERPVICNHCQSRFYADDAVPCSLCRKNCCPSCRQCSCQAKTTPILARNDVIRRNTRISIAEILANKAPEQRKNLEVAGTLSPLERQEIIATRNRNLVLSFFSFYDGGRKIGFRVWGPLPHELYEHRYSPGRVVIKGVSVSKYAGELQLTLQRNGFVTGIGQKSRSLYSELGVAEA